MLLKNVGNENSPDSLNVMVNCHYHGENRVINREFPSMIPRRETFEDTFLGRLKNQWITENSSTS